MKRLARKPGSSTGGALVSLVLAVFCFCHATLAQVESASATTLADDPVLTTALQVQLLSLEFLHPGDHKITVGEAAIRE